MVSQLSVAVAWENSGAAGQEIVEIKGNSFIIGLWVSLTVNVAVVFVAFPHASVAVNITVTAVEQSLDNELKLFDQVTFEQLSVAVAAPLFCSQLFNALSFPDPSHSTKRLDACTLITGAVVSWTVIICVNVSEILPQSSVTIHVLV